MALLSVQEATLAFGGPRVLESASLQLETDERVGLLGRNGAGKSSLMRLINGDLTADSGQVLRRAGLRTALLAQDIPASLKGSCRQIIAQGLPPDLTAPPPFSQRLDAILTRMSLDGKAAFRTLSGGMQRRVLLARALVGDPQVLLLDEPTNHLDIDAIIWLERFLMRFRGAVMFVTHDRAFLRQLATRIVLVDRGRLASFPCDYDSYLRRRAARLSAETKADADFDRALAQEEIWIRQGIRARRTRNEGRVRALERMREQRRQRRQRAGTVHLAIQQAQDSGHLVIEARDVTFGYDHQPVIQAFSALITRGDRIGVVGPNGAGKTTLLRILLGQLPPQQGRVRHGTQLQVAYFDQQRERLDLQATAAHNIAGGLEYVTINGRRRHLYGYLQDFLFTPDRARTPVHVLSGGERNRLLLARLFTRPANLLVLDEPTNDLDVETLELLEERLLEYTGTLLLVSHDRAFLDHVVTSLLVLKDGGRVREYLGGYSSYLAQRQDAPPRTADSARERAARAATRPARQRARRLTFKEQRELEELPDRIESLETARRLIHEQLGDPHFYRHEDGRTIADAQTRLENLQKESQRAYQRWEELTIIAEAST